MRDRLGVLACVLVVGLVVLATIEPRLHHSFPSMIDDWNAIASAPEQFREVVRLGNPEKQRYRPGFIAWNALQWHTLGGPRGAGPQAWGILRLAILVVGTTLLAALLIRTAATRPGARDLRLLLVAAVPLAVLTVPSLAIDFARYGPQEPLMVGAMSLAAVMLVRSVDRLLAIEPPGLGTLVITVGGLAIWAFGVAQKESSVAVLALVPFLWPTIRAQRSRWTRVPQARRVLIGGVGVALLLPFVPMAVRTVGLARGDDRVYQEFASGRSLYDRAWDQLVSADESLQTPLLWILIACAVVLVTVRTVRIGADWLAIGLIVTATAFFAFVVPSGTVNSRYYLPTLVLLALALARAAVPLGSAPVIGVAVFLLGAGALQTREAHAWVESWLRGEKKQETIVREAAARAAGGCPVSVTGRNVELVRALRVLMHVADEPPRDCAPGQRFVVVVDWTMSATGLDDPTLSACAPATEAVWAIPEARIVRCTA